MQRLMTKNLHKKGHIRRNKLVSKNKILTSIILEYPIFSGIWVWVTSKIREKKGIRVRYSETIES